MNLPTQIKKENILRIGICTVRELEEKVRAFRTINLHSRRKRYIISREEIIDDSERIIVNKNEDIDYPKAMLLRRVKKENEYLKTFQPDEGIAIVSDMSNAAGIQVTMDLVTQIMNIGGGAYEAFIDRIDGFQGLDNLMSKAFFPKMVIVGYIPPEKIPSERRLYKVMANKDPYLRFVEILHTKIKSEPIIENMKQIVISADDKNGWKKFILDVIKEYTKSYNIEER
ncbi:MAG: hypothetical protein OEZ13_00015 [Spirochaetia bacterium]|nr:hypothetical protein [Spirochaetia bacterium]